MLIQELQAAGGPESIPALTACLGDAELCESAVQALLAIRDGVAEPLRKALGGATGRCLVAIAQTLGVLQDSAALPALRQLLTKDDPDTRRVAAWALANMGDENSTLALLQFTDSADGWERSHATGLCHLMAERLVAAGKKDRAADLYKHLRDTRTDPAERHVSEAAGRALKALQ
jgi:HEAT repeat protein